MAAAKPTMQKQETSLGVTEKNIREAQIGKKDEDADLLAEDDEFEEFDAESMTPHCTAAHHHAASTADAI